MVFQAAAVILAVKRKQNRLYNLAQYYDQLEEYFDENFPGILPEDYPEDLAPEFPLPDYFPAHDFPIPAELLGPDGWFGYKHFRPGAADEHDYGNYNYQFFRRNDQDTSHPSPLPSSRQLASTYHKRSLQAAPAAENLQEAVQKILKAKDVQDVVMQTAQLVQDVVGRMDEDGCLLKLLCLLQEKPKDTRAPEEELLVSLYHLNAPEGSPRCGQEILKCPVEEAQLLEAFAYTWHLQNNA